MKGYDLLREFRYVTRILLKNPWASGVISKDTVIEVTTSYLAIEIDEGK